MFLCMFCCKFYTLCAKTASLFNAYIATAQISSNEKNQSRSVTMTSCAMGCLCVCVSTHAHIYMYVQLGDND